MSEASHPSSKVFRVQRQLIIPGFPMQVKACLALEDGGELERELHLSPRQ